MTLKQIAERLEQIEALWPDLWPDKYDSSGLRAIERLRLDIERYLLTALGRL